MSRKSFIKGAAILGAAGIIVKILGACFRIPLANIIGDTGMGYYQTAYPLYVLLLNISIAGIPSAIARLVSERTAEGNHREAYRVFRLSFGLLAGIGIVTCLILVIGAPFFVRFSDHKAIYAIWSISPALLIMPVMAAYRGYFQGLQDMTPTALSQVTEQLFRVAAGLCLAVLLVPYGLEYAAAGATSGAAVGGAFGLAVIFVIYMRKKNTLKEQINGTPDDMPSEKSSRIVKKLVIIAIPITIGASIMPIMNGIDLAIVSNRLVDAGFSQADATSLYGQLSGFAAPLINFPQVITQGIALSLVPAIAAAVRTRDYKTVKTEAETGMRMAMIVGMPCGVGLLVLSGPIMQLLYPAQKEAAAGAAECLAILAVGAIFLSSVQALTGVLQGAGRQMIPVINLVAGAGVKIVVTYVLTGIAEINVNGAAIGTVCAYLTASLLNMRAVSKYTGARFGISITFLRPGASAAAMGAAAWLVQKGVSVFAGAAAGTCVAVAVAVVVYTVLIFAVRAVTEEELMRFPKGEKIVHILRKFKKN